MKAPKLSTVMSEILEAVKSGPVERPTEKWMNKKLGELRTAAHAWNQTACNEGWLNTIGDAEWDTKRWIAIIHRDHQEQTSSLDHPPLRELYDKNLRLLEDLKHLESTAVFVPGPTVEEIRAEWQQIRDEQKKHYEQFAAEDEARIAAMTETLVKRYGAPTDKENSVTVGSEAINKTETDSAEVDASQLTNPQHSAATENKASPWNEADAEKPAEYSFGPLTGQRKQLTKWILNDDDPRNLDTKLEIGVYWARKILKNKREVWFKNQQAYSQANTAMLKEQSQSTNKER